MHFSREKFSRLLILLVISTLTIPVSVKAENLFHYNGYYKSFFTIEIPPDHTPASTKYANRNLLRMGICYEPNGFLSFNGAYSLAPRFQGVDVFSVPVAGAPQNIYRIDDLNYLFYHPTGNFGLYHNLDRAYSRLKYSSADVYLGRQAISWGSARAINPTDILIPFGLTELDKEERTGVDAIRIRFPAGQLNELDLGSVFGKNFQAKDSAYFIRHKANINNTDISVLLIDFRENLLAGLDLAFSIKGAGIWLEAAQVAAGAFKSGSRNKSEDYFRISFGSDYSFNENMYSFLEYHYNGAGASKPENYDNVNTKTAYSEGAVYLLGRHYLIPGITYQFTPLISLSAQAHINLRDGSFFTSPQLDYNITQNIYLSCGILVGTGKDPEQNSSGITTIRSEFGSYSNLYFSSFRYYF